MKILRITLILCLILFNMELNAQEVNPDQQLTITLKDGTVYHGASIVTGKQIGRASCRERV